MADRFNEYNETTDLYLAILREAQRVEDKKLIQLITRKLTPEFDMLSSCPAGGGCRIIPFPCPLVRSEPMEEKPFWPKFAYTQMAILLSSYLAVVFIHGLL